MKQLTLLITLFLSYFNVCSQSIKPFDLQDFKGKRIISSLKITEVTPETPDSKGISLVGVDRVYTRQIVIKNDKKKPGNILVERSLKRYQVFSDINSGKATYDSDNKFDRDAGVNLAFGSFDSMINEVVECHFNEKGIFTDTLTNRSSDNAFQIESFHVGNADVYKNYLNTQWSTIFQTSLAEKSWKVGDKFKDYRIRKNNDFLNDYEVKTIENNVITLYLKGQRLPKNFQIFQKGLDAMQKMLMVANGKFIYEGTIVFNSDTKLISKVNLNVKTFSVGTPKEELLMTKEVEVLNKMSKVK
jgi:hypothetical protein